MMLHMPSGCDLYPATPPRSLSYSNQSPHKNLQQPNVTIKAPASGAKSHDTHIGLSSRQFASKNCFIEYPCARSTQKLHNSNRNGCHTHAHRRQPPRT